MRDKMRDRLIELLQEYTDCNNGGGSNHGCADHLLENGIIVPPCNIGETIWYIDKKYTIQNAEVTSIDIRGATSRHIVATRYVWETEETIKLALMFERLNVDYWLTKEGAEDALAKMKGGTK